MKKKAALDTRGRMVFKNYPQTKGCLQYHKLNPYKTRRTYFIHPIVQEEREKWLTWYQPSLLYNQAQQGCCPESNSHPCFTLSTSVEPTHISQVHCDINLC